MGASQSDIASYVDPGPAVNSKRITRAIISWEQVDDVQVESIEEETANAKGEGFVSTLSFLKIKARVGGKSKEYHWILKSTPREANRAVMSQKLRLDEREVAFFSYLKPKLEIFLINKELSSLMPPFCQVPYSAWTNDDKILVMENLKTHGWRDAINKKAGLDVYHLRLGAKWLATYHAITANFLEEFPGGEEAAKKEMDMFFWKLLDFPEVRKMLNDYREPTNTNMRSILVQMDQKYPGEDRLARYNALAEKYQDINTKAWKLRDEGDFAFKTICHGDPWFNNMMFKYNEETLQEVMLIDFQMVCYLAPALDLTYMMSASSTGHIRRDNLDHLLTFYHTTFTLTLERLGSNIKYSYETFREDYKKALLYGFAFAVQALPNVCAEKVEDVVDVEEFLEAFGDGDEDEKQKKLKELMELEREKLSGSPALLERIKDLFDDMVLAGII